MGKTRTSFKKGQSGNPKGGPHKYETWKAVINNYSIKSIPELQKLDLNKIPAKTALVVGQILKAYLEGDTSIIKWLAERTDGKPDQYLETKQEIISETPLAKALKSLRESK